MQQQPIQIWNTARSVWEIPLTENLLCAHLEAFSGTWQTSGMMRHGQVFELPTQVLHTIDFESLSSPILRTPAASEAERGHQPEEKARARGGQVTLSGQFLGTPRTSSANAPTSKEMNNGAAKARLEDQAVGSVVGNIDWGKFEPAIRRWESVLGREAPNPTKPDGKDSGQRLSSRFTEWMMGVPDGWITDVGLSRNDELKACGNGVVPQQAELALKILLEGVSFDSERGGGQTVLPTPTVMDQREGKSFRSVAIRNLKEGFNRGLNLNNVTEAGLLDWNEGDKFEVIQGQVKKIDEPK